MNMKPNYVDYSSVIKISTSPFTAPSGGILTYTGVFSPYDNTKEIKVNNSMSLDNSSALAGYASGNLPGKIVPLKAGDRVTFNGNVIVVKFFPYLSE